MYLEAARLGSTDRVQDLLRRGARAVATDSQGHTALHHAAKQGHTDVVKVILNEAPAVILDMVDNQL